MIWLEISVNKKYKPIKPTKRTIKTGVISNYTLYLQKIKSDVHGVKNV